jgi:hypothetical protein
MNRRAALRKAERAAQVVTRFEEWVATVVDRDGERVPVLRYDDGRGDDGLPSAVLLEHEHEHEPEHEPAPPSLPVWPGPHPPPPLVANLYAPYSPPPRPMIVCGHREAPRPAVLRRRRRAL